MKMQTKATASFIGLLGLLSGILTASPLGTAFTYQGKLTDGGAPASGTYDLVFTLFDAASGPTAVAGPITNSAVGVINGLFTVTLDFGLSAFSGDARWLEIAARTNGAGAFATFPARQPLTGAPYALYAANAGFATTASSANVATIAHTVASNAITSASIAPGQVVKSLNGLQDTITLAAGANVTLATNGNTLQISATGAGGGSGWSLTGNSGTSPGADFIGTTDNQPLEFKVNGQRALHLEPGGSNSVNVAGGWSGNTIATGVAGATIAGGGAGNYNRMAMPNLADADFATIGGGGGNTIGIGGEFATISGGEWNTIGTNSINGVIGGGYQNSLTGTNDLCTIGGGGWNEILGHAGRSTIGGGDNNLIAGGSATPWSTLSSTIAGGRGNLISGSDLCTIGGGYLNSIQTNQESTIGGGRQNTVSKAASYGVVSGGFNNTAGGQAATVAGGSYNGALAEWATVAGGRDQLATNSYAAVVGGRANIAGGPGSFVGGGGWDGSTVGGNFASGAASTIGGGGSNQIGTNATGGVIGGGWGNSVDTLYGTVGGGANNSAGTHFDPLSAQYGQATVAGGQENQAGGAFATVGGGLKNVASGVGAVVGGGGVRSITPVSLVAEGNNAWGMNATVPGGEGNLAKGDYSFAAGHGAAALDRGAFVWADSADASFDSIRKDEFAIRAAGGVRIQSYRGIAQNAANAPIITCGYDPFDAAAGAPPEKQGLGRWGLFMEPFNLVLGIPGDDVPGRGFQVAKYAQDGSWVGLMRVDQSGNLFTAGTVNPPSDRDAKTNFASVAVGDVLELVAGLPIQTWNYKTDETRVRHIGPMAQDFHAAFHLGTDDKHISTVDADGVALAAIQGLNEKVESGKQKAESRMERLEAENAELKQRLERLERLLTQNSGAGQ